MNSPDGYGNLMPIGPRTRLFESSVERQQRQAIELVRAQAEVVRAAEQCRAQLAVNAMGNVVGLIQLGERLAAQNPSAVGHIEHLINAYANSAAWRIADFR